jgi:hypothetical protein
MSYRGDMPYLCGLFTPHRPAKQQYASLVALLHNKKVTAAVIATAPMHVMQCRIEEQSGTLKPRTTVRHLSHQHGQHLSSNLQLNHSRSAPQLQPAVEPFTNMFSAVL